MMKTSVVERREQLWRVGLRLVMIDKQLRLVCCNHLPNPIHGGALGAFWFLTGGSDILKLSRTAWSSALPIIATA
jgi:hypothetical protein